MESNGGAARSAESACLPPLHRLGLGQRGGARCQIIAPQIGDAQVPGDQATSRLVLLELLESLKCEFNGARGVPLWRQLKHLNNRKEQRDLMGTALAGRTGSDVGVRAADAFAAR